jgi:hypothetical protein
MAAFRTLGRSAQWPRKGTNEPRCPIQNAHTRRRRLTRRPISSSGELRSALAKWRAELMGQRLGHLSRLEFSNENAPLRRHIHPNRLSWNLWARSIVKPSCWATRSSRAPGPVHRVLDVVVVVVIVARTDLNRTISPTLIGISATSPASLTRMASGHACPAWPVTTHREHLAVSVARAGQPGIYPQRPTRRSPTA